MPNYSYKRNTKKAADRMDELGIDMVQSINAHLKDLQKRIHKEEAKNKPNRQNLLAYLKEQELMLSALAPYQFVKPATALLIDNTDLEGTPVAVSLSVAVADHEEKSPK